MPSNFLNSEPKLGFLAPRNPRLLSKIMRANHLNPNSEYGFARGIIYESAGTRPKEKMTDLKTLSNDDLCALLTKGAPKDFKDMAAYLDVFEEYTKRSYKGFKTICNQRIEELNPNQASS